MSVARRSRALGRGIVAFQLMSSAAAASNSISVSISSDSAPSDISQSVDVSFGGFGIEPSNLFSFTGQETQNDLTMNLLQNLGNYTGKPPHIRLGGNTQDYMIYDESQDQWSVQHNDNANGNGSIKWDSQLIGPRFFEAANRFPEGTPVTWGLNLAYNEDDYIDQLTTMAQQVLDRCTNLNIVSFEIGNEPDLYYTSSDFRDSTWSGSIYTDQWLSRASAIYSQVVEPAGLNSDFFEPGATSHTSGTTFGISDLVSAGITDKVNGSTLVASWNQHDYSYFYNVATYALTLESILSFDTNENQFENQASDQLEQAEDTSYGYALREMGMVGPTGTKDVTDTFAGALYTLNFLLYAASKNISSVQFHLTAGSYTSAWQPVQMDGVAAYPRPLYYGHAAFNQIIGPTCTAQVTQYDLSSIPSGYDGRLRAYSVYQAGSLQTIVVLNSKVSNTTETDKANVTVSLSLPSSLAGKTVHLAYLTSDGTDSKYNTTWNGISYEESGDGTPTTVSDDDETVSVGNDGSLTFNVRDSQAVVANLESKVGEGLEADSTACSEMASRSPGTHASTSSESSSAASTTSKPHNDGTSSGDDSSGGDNSSGSADPSNSAGMRGLTSSSSIILTLLAPALSMVAGILLF